MKQFIQKNQTTIVILLVLVVGYISYKMFYTPKTKSTDTEAVTTASFDGNLEKSPIK